MKFAEEQLILLKSLHSSDTSSLEKEKKKKIAERNSPQDLQKALSKGAGHGNAKAYSREANLT